jgi:hypothetical protein
MAGLAERLRRVSVAHNTGVQVSYPAPTIRGRGASGNTSVLHSEVGGSTPSVSTRYLSAKPPDLSSIWSKSGARFAQGDQPDEPQDDCPRTNFFIFAACVGLVITLV